MTEIQGDPGQAGPAGEQGPAGPGTGLVWKDGTGAIVPDAVVLYDGRKFAMLVRDEHGVFFDVSPMSGVFNYATVSNGAPNYLTTNCSGPAQQLVDVPPSMAFQFDGRVIALPPDVAVATIVHSYYSTTSGCQPTSYVAPYVATETLTSLPTLNPPTLKPGPYHVEPR